MALIPIKTIQLKDGTEVLLRCVDDRDALALLDATRAIFADGDGMVIDPDEFEKTEAQEKTWIRELNDNPPNLLLVAEAHGHIVGNLDFHSAKRRRLAHTGEFGMSVQPAWRNRGIGTALHCLNALSNGHEACQRLIKSVSRSALTIGGPLLSIRSRAPCRTLQNSHHWLRLHFFEERIEP